MDFKDSCGAERECEGVLLLANEIPPNVQKQQTPPGGGGGRKGKLREPGQTWRVCMKEEGPRK